MNSTASCSSNNIYTLETAVTILQEQQRAYYKQNIESALTKERLRTEKLHAVKSYHEARLLENEFIMERYQEKELLHQIKKDHDLVLKTKIKEWKRQLKNGECIYPPQVPSMNNEIENELIERDASKKQIENLKLTKTTLKRLSTPKYSNHTNQQGLNKHIDIGETTQQVEFAKQSYRKQEKYRKRLIHQQSLPVLDANYLREKQIQYMSEHELLQTKMNLLTELHGVVTTQESLVRDTQDQWTVRSKVSSWKS